MSICRYCCWCFFPKENPLLTDDNSTDQKNEKIYNNRSDRSVGSGRSAASSSSNPQDTDIQNISKENFTEGSNPQTDSTSRLFNNVKEVIKAPQHTTDANLNEISNSQTDSTSRLLNNVIGVLKASPHTTDANLNEISNSQTDSTSQLPSNVKEVLKAPPHTTDANLNEVSNSQTDSTSQLPSNVKEVLKAPQHTTDGKTSFCAAYYDLSDGDSDGMPSGCNSAASSRENSPYFQFRGQNKRRTTFKDDTNY